MPRTPTAPTRSVGGVVLDVLLWVVQILYGLFFAGSGFGKILFIDTELYERAPDAVSWYAAVPQWLIVIIGVCEVLGGLGLILPALSRVRTGLIALAAAGLTLIMVLATGFHLLRGELPLAAVTIVLGLIGAFTAVGRWCLRPTESRPLTPPRIVWTIVVLLAIVLLVFAPVAWVSTQTRF